MILGKLKSLLSVNLLEQWLFGLYHSFETVLFQCISDYLRTNRLSVRAHYDSVWLLSIRWEAVTLEIVEIPERLRLRYW